ncbi:hypothetical protein PVBG_02347 [Plasmodium vivax Brazil I]|uniref:Protein kinase domain-containing protein n=1 Tax=Plasmodium vivax (strain Brazil I) TaxID=1033975 RepID=A0A0J9SLY3_PLAV1|nr:hypothetical protein PVBG_02347 [Plasmodium vivax Brazil I]
MFKKDIQEFYIKNCIENIYIVKRHYADGNVEEKKSSVLYKNIDEFVRVLIQIRKFDKEFKKINIKKNESGAEETLQEYLDFYVGHFGHKFHSFILEYKNGSVKDDLKNHYIIKKLTKSDIEKVAKNSYARVMFMYDRVKYLLYYVKRRIAKIREIDEGFVKLLMSYLRVSLNPLNLIAHVYLSGCGGRPSPDQAKKGILHNGNPLNGGCTNGRNPAGKNVSPVRDPPVVDAPPKDPLFCNELCQFVCAYGEYIVKHTISSSYVELLSPQEIIKSKLSIYESAKRHIRSYILKKICSYAHFKKCSLSAQFDHTTCFSAHEGDLIKCQKIFKRFTQVGSGYKNVSMSHRDFSYIYELVLAVYLVKKCLFHLNENIDAVLQVALYTLYSSAKVAIIYLYFNLPKHMAHYFLNVYLLFFKSKKKNSEGQSQGKKTAHIMNRMRRTYRNVLRYVVKREKRGAIDATPYEAPPYEVTPYEAPPYEVTPYEVIPHEVTPHEVTPLGGKVKTSERKRYSKILNLLYFQTDSYDKKWANQKIKREVKKFVALHMNASVIQLKYNYEVLLRKRKKGKKETPPKVGPAKTEKGDQPMTHQNGAVSRQKKRSNVVPSDRIEYMKRYAPLYRTECRRNSKGGKNADRNGAIHVQTNTVNYSMHNRVIYNYRDGEAYAGKEKKRDKEKEVTFQKNFSSSEKHIIGKLFNCVLKNLQKGNQFTPSNTREIDAANPFDDDDDDGERKQDERNGYEDSHLSAPSEEVSKADESITYPARTILNEHERGGETPESCYLSRNGSIQSEAKLECEISSEGTLDKRKPEINSVETVKSKDMQEGGEETEEVGSEDGEETPNEVDHTVKRQDGEIAYTHLDPPAGKTLSSVEKSPQEGCDERSKKREMNGEVQSGEGSPPEKIQNEIEKVAYGKKADDSSRHGSKTEGHTEKDAFDKRESPEKEKQSDNSRGTCSSENIILADLLLTNNCTRRIEGKYKIFFSNDSDTMDVSSDDYVPYRTAKRGKKKRGKAAAKGKKRTSAKKSARKSAKMNEKMNEKTKGKEKEGKPRKGEAGQAPKPHSSKTKKRKRSQLTDEETVKTKKGKSNRSHSYHSVEYDHSKRNEVVDGEERSCTSEGVSHKQSRERKTGAATEEHAALTNGERRSGPEKVAQVSEAKPPTTDDTAMPGSARKLIFNVSLNGSVGGEEYTPCKYEFGGRTNWGSNGKAPICDGLVPSEDNPQGKEVSESRMVARGHGKKEKTGEQADKRLDEELQIDRDMPQLGMPRFEIPQFDIPQFDMPFMCTRQVYLNERVCDVAKETEERLKLIVVHLFNYYIIGGVFLINPYNSAQKERYRHFTSMQENINDIEHTKIFRYSSHELTVGIIRKNTKVSLLGGSTSKRVIKFLNRQGKGLNGATYKCIINNALHACKIQQRLYLAKKEIFFSYILKTRKMLKCRKYSEQRKGILGRGGSATEGRSEYSLQESRVGGISSVNGLSSSGEVFFEVYAKGSLYIFPDELHYKVHKAWGGSEGQRGGAKGRTNRGGKRGGKRGGNRARAAKHDAGGRGEQRSEQRSEEQSEQRREEQSEQKSEEQSEQKSEEQREQRSEEQSERQSSERGTSLLIMGTHKHVTSLNELINTFIRKGYQAINEELVLFIVYHLIVALLQLHVLDVLHGDVKIDNILVAKDEELLPLMERTKEHSPREAPSTCKGEKKREPKRMGRPPKEGNSSSSRSSRSSSGIRGDSSRSSSGIHAGSSRSSSGIRSVRSTRSIRGTHGSINSFLCEYMLNVKPASNPNSFLRKKFPLNVFLIDIGRGIDVKNFRNYLFYGEKNCDCYNFLSDSIFSYHIDFIGIAQVASCLLYYKHLGSKKYKYDGSIMDQNYTTINNLNVTYMTHNNNFAKSRSVPVRKKRRDPRKGKRKSRCKEIESFIKVKERAYTEDEEKHEKEGCADRSGCLEGGDSTGGGSNHAGNAPNPEEHLQRSGNLAVNQRSGNLAVNQRSGNLAGNQRSGNLAGNKRTAKRITAAESNQFIDYSKNIPMDDRDREKIDGYIDQMKKNNEHYYIEREEESKIKNFSVKLLSTRKKYVDFWEVFFHLLLNFCNVYELSSVNYNSKEIGTNFEKANLFHHKVMNKTENYYFDFCKNNWEEVPQGDRRKRDAPMGEKLNGFVTGSDHLDARGGEALCRNGEVLCRNGEALCCNGEAASCNGDNHSDSAVMDVHHTGEAKQEMGKLCHHDNTSTDDGSNACVMQNGRCGDEKEALEGQPRKETHEEPRKGNSHQTEKTNLERETTKGAALDKQNEQTGGDQPKSNSKYFFIKNSISNLKNIKKKMHKVKHKIERDKFEASNDKGKNHSCNFSGKEENVSLKRKMIFFENEQNRQKCRKLNDQKYYAKECRANDTKRLARYVNKLTKKKAIFVLMFLKRAIEKIFDDDKSRQEILLSELKNAAAFF